MFRTICVSLLAVALCALQSGCCCCRGFGAMMRPPPIVFNPPPPVVFDPPPIVIQPPPIDNNPFKDNNNPFKDNFPLKDNNNPFKDNFPLKDKTLVKDKKASLKDNNPFKDKAGFQEGPINYVYERATGTLKLNNQVLGVGYSGKGAARNNAAMEAQRDGPIPIGEYLITGRQNDFRFGDMIGLLPVAGGNFFNRFPGEAFGILPETNPPNNPPSGCFIVVPANVLNAMKVPPLSKVRVVQ